MNLVALTIPDQPEELPGWLEGQLLGPDLGALVAELAAVHGFAGKTPKSIADLLGPHRSVVLKRGLGSLPRNLIKELMRHPAYLLDLQELILIEGSDYWIRRLNQSAVTAPIPKLTSQSPTVVKPITMLKNPFVVMVLTAAAVVVLGFIIDPGRWFRDKPTTQTLAARGWARSDAFQNDANAAAYLRKIATISEDYLSKGPESAEELATRITEFRAGCTRLLLAEHAQLTEAGREDLRKRCRNWAAKLDAQLAALEKDPKQAPTISGEVDQLARTLATTLRGQADKV